MNPGKKMTANAKRSAGLGNSAIRDDHRICSIRCLAIVPQRHSADSHKIVRMTIIGLPSHLSFVSKDSYINLLRLNQPIESNLTIGRKSSYTKVSAG